MATNDKQDTPGSRPAGITCPHYKAIPGRKHCRHYLTDGACSRPDEFMCREWMKANGHLVGDATPVPAGVAHDSPLHQVLASSPVDLFGNRNPDYQPARAEVAAAVPSDASPARPSVPVSPGEGVEAAGRSVSSPPRGLTTDDIDSFKALGVEVCLNSEAFGELWLVPEYTGQGRKELTPEHVATIWRVVEAFPGARVVSFEKIPSNDEETKA